MRRRTLRFGYGLMVIAATSWGRVAPAQEPSAEEPSAQEPSEPARAQLTGQLEQSTLPALAARRSSAQARSAAAQSYFDGEGDWEQAFPDYVDTSFGDAGALAARREILHRRALARAIERIADPPAALSADHARRWSAGRDAAVEAEESADAAEARFVASLEAALERAPALADLSVERRFRELSNCMAVPAEADAAARNLAVACSAEDQALRQWRRAAWTAVTRPRDTTLSSLVADALSTPPVHDAPADTRLRGTHDRLTRVRPLLTARASDADAWIDAAADLLDGQALAVEEPTAAPSVDEPQLEAEDAPPPSADAHTPPAEAVVLVATAAVRQQTVATIEAENIRRTGALAQIAEWRREIDAGKTALSNALARTSLDPQRQPSIDEAYLNLRKVTKTLSEAGAESDRALTEARRELAHPRAGDPAVSGADAESIVERDDATADLGAVLRARSVALESERNALVGLLVEAKHARRAARADASPTARDAGRQAYVPELAAEVREIGIVAAGRWGESLATLRGVPRALTDLTVVVAVTRSSFRFLLMLVAWWILRRAVGGWIRGAVDRVVAARPRDETVWAAIARFLQARLEPGDANLLVEPSSRVVRGLLDATAAAFVAEFVGARLPLFGLLAWIWFAVIVWVTAPRLVNLLFATEGEARPSIRRIEEATRARLLRTVRWLLAWGLATLLLKQGLLEVLAADKLTQLVDAISAVVGVLLALFLVYDWAEPIRRATAAAEPSRASRWAATAGSRLMVVPRTVVGAAVLTGSWVGALFTEATRSSSRTDLRWLGALLARRQLGAEADVDGRPLDVSLRERLSALDHGTPRNVDAALSSLLELHAEWSRVHRHGLVTITGDRGSGVEQIGEWIERQTTATVVRVPRRISRPEEAIGWLAEALGHPGSNPEALAQSLAAQRGRVVVLVDTHRLFLRTVGGFAVLRAIFDVMQATSEEMFWVVVMNAPTWRFLKGTPGAVDLGVFRARLDVGGLANQDLATWLLEPVRAAGFEPSFRALTRTPDSERVDPRAEQRAMRLYFRLLADLSQGRPAAARSIWLSSLREGLEPHRIEHAVPASAAAREIDALADEDLFLCTSLALHGELDIPTLTIVLNRDPGVIRSACLRLESLGILRGDENGEWFDLDGTLHPLVLRVLRHRAFLEAA